MKDRSITIFSQKMAGYLMLRGQQLLAIGPNTRRPGYNVFIFKDTEELRKIMKEFSKHNGNFNVN